MGCDGFLVCWLREERSVLDPNLNGLVDCLLPIDYLSSTVARTGISLSFDYNQQATCPH
jgi:hypothetical protein